MHGKSVILMNILSSLYTEAKPIKQINMAAAPLTYSRYQLFAVYRQRQCRPISSAVWSTVKQLNINKPKRGCRSGRNRQRNIRSTIWDGCYQAQHRHNGVISSSSAGTSVINKWDNWHDARKGTGVNTDNLITISCASTDLKLQVCLLNAQSVKARDKALRINDHIFENAYDVFVLTETWLRPGCKDSVSVGDLAPPGYSVLHEPRSTGRGGGVGIIIRDTVKATKEPSRVYETFEYMHVKATTSSFTYRFITVYRPPPSRKNRLKYSDFIDEFDEFLSDVVMLKGKLVILGDLNIHLDSIQSADCVRFDGLLQTYALVQLVKEATHRGNHTLDAVITRRTECPVSDVTVYDPLLSDHKAVSFSLDTQRPPLPKKEIVYRQIKKIDTNRLREDITANKHLNGDFLKDETDCATCVRVYNDAARLLLDKHAPQKTKLVTIRPKAEWYTQSVDRARKEKRKCERKWRATKLNVHKQIFREACDQLFKVITAAKKDHLSQRIAESSESQKALFSCVDHLLHRSRASVLPDVNNMEELAESFAAFFEEKIRKIRDELEAAQKDEEKFTTALDDAPVPNLVSFPPVTAEVLRKIILKAPTKSCQLDPIPTKILKECIEPLLPVLLKIINSSLATSTVPEVFKQASITPLLKKPSLDRNVLKNYRPVSNLPFLSKILEKVVSNALSEHRSKNSLDIPLQSAYRQHHSTETALLKVHNDVLRALDRKECVFLVLLDLSAAFDTVDHGQLKVCLEQQFGVSHAALQWLDSYLSERQQAVTVNGTGSETRTLKYGVPQGSVLGPELFKDYASPLSSVIQSFDVCSGPRRSYCTGQNSTMHSSSKGMDGTELPEAQR